MSKLEGVPQDSSPIQNQIVNYVAAAVEKKATSANYQPDCFDLSDAIAGDIPENATAQDCQDAVNGILDRPISGSPDQTTCRQALGLLGINSWFWLVDHVEFYSNDRSEDITGTIIY